MDRASCLSGRSSLCRNSSNCAGLNREAALGIGIDNKTAIAKKANEIEAHLARQFDGET